MKKYQYKNQTGGYGGCMASGLKLGFIILVICFIWAMMSCTKETIGENHYTFDKYEMVIDWYNPDTTNGRTKYIQVFDSIYKDETRLSFDTLKDMWYRDCNIIDTLQHLYYKKNGKKIQPSKYPLNSLKPK